MTTLAELDTCCIILTFDNTTTFHSFMYNNQASAQECLAYAIAKYKEEEDEPMPKILDIKIKR